MLLLGKTQKRIQGTSHQWYQTCPLHSRFRYKCFQLILTSKLTIMQNIQRIQKLYSNRITSKLMQMLVTSK